MILERNPFVEVHGNDTWKEYGTFEVHPDTGYLHHEFPEDFATYWVRLSTNKDCTATAYFMYN